jgi:ABC-type polysaccharide/polyol phosphate transport system ATPase subunit
VTIVLSDTKAPTTAEPAIIVDDVSKRFRLYKERSSSLKERVTALRRSVYDEYWALKNVSFAVPRGSTFGLIGHNGSGKSTLLRLMAGIHRPTGGKVHVDGRVSALLELGAGFHPDLTGRENIYLNGSILGLNRKTINAKIEEIVEFAGLGEFIDTPVKIYSSGMFVRLGFSVAVHVDPDILIIDEVIAVGDEDFQRRCFDHLYRLRSNGATIVMVTHSLNLVQQMCDNAAWLDHGELKALGAAPDVVHHYLDQVNVVEAERIGSHEVVGGADGASIDVEADAAHGLIKLLKVEFLDDDGKPTMVAAPRQPLTLRIHWASTVPVEEPLFSFAVENEAGVYVANPGMRATGAPGERLLGEGYVDYRMDDLVLGPGQYTFSVAAHDHSGTTVLDKRERFITLRVQPGSHVVNGLVSMMGTWDAPVSTTEAAQ